MNRGAAEPVDNTAPGTALEAWPEGPPAPIDTDGFTVTDVMRRWANEVHPHVNLTHSTQQFISHYRSTGARRRNWPEAWRKWIAEDADRAARRPGNVFHLPTGQTLTGTDAKVAGWMAIAQQLRQQGDSA